MLLGILMPSLGKARRVAMRMKCQHNLRQINLAMEMYLDNNNSFYICSKDEIQDGGSWLWMGRGLRKYLQNYLVDNINKDNPSVLYCPQDKSDEDIYERTSYAYSMSFYHSVSQIQQMTDQSYTYDPTKQMPTARQHRNNVKYPSQKLMIGEWGCHHYRLGKESDPGWWGWLGKRNFIFADGSGDFIDAKDISEANDGWPDINLTIKGISGKDRP